MDKEICLGENQLNGKSTEEKMLDEIREMYKNGTNNYSKSKIEVINKIKRKQDSKDAIAQKKCRKVFRKFKTVKSDCDRVNSVISEVINTNESLYENFKKAASCLLKDVDSTKNMLTELIGSGGKK